MTNVYTRLRLCEYRGSGPLIALVLARGWLRDEDVLVPDYLGAPYAAGDQRHKGVNWLPSPAQRLYLDAFDRLLRERTDEAADDLAFFSDVLFRVAECDRPRRPPRDVDDVLLALGRALSRPIPLDERAAA